MSEAHLKTHERSPSVCLEIPRWRRSHYTSEMLWEWRGHSQSAEAQWMPRWVTLRVYRNVGSSLVASSHLTAMATDCMSGWLHKASAWVHLFSDVTDLWVPLHQVDIGKPESASLSSWWRPETGCQQKESKDFGFVVFSFIETFGKAETCEPIWHT